MACERTSEVLAVTLFAACLVFQLFVPPSIGLANNGDFSKMIGRFSLGPETHDTSEEYRYFTARWLYDRSFQWMSNDVSSELIPISAAVLIGWWFSSHVFDIRILGAIHASLWIACFAMLLPLLRFLTGWRRVLAISAALFIFTDVSYVAHFNTFYTDVSGFLFLAWGLVLWLYVITGQAQSRALFVLFGAAPLLCVASKAQHAPLGVFLAALVIMTIPVVQQPWHRMAVLAIATLIIFVAVATVRMMPNTERQANQYHVIFMSILHNSPTPEEDLRELGLGQEYLRYVGYWPQRTEDDPMENPEWRNSFTSRTNFTRILFFHLRHPWRTAVIIYRAVHDQARFRRPWLGNYTSASGFPPGAQTKTFGWWSGLRSGIFRIAPWHIVVWYLAILAMGIRLGLRRPVPIISQMGWFAVLLALMGLVELAVSALTDTGETARHLFLFHVITDFTIILAVVWALWTPEGRASLRAKS